VFQLEKLPSSIGQLYALQELDLLGCSNLKKLHSSIGQLSPNKGHPSYYSAIQLLNNNHYKIEDVNHLTICQPPNKDHPSYYLLKKCVETLRLLEQG
jgi:hypothetical protein